MDVVGIFQDIQKGIAEYRDQLCHWHFTFCRPENPMQYEGEEADGAIAAVASLDIEASWKRFPRPVVNVSHSLPTCQFPSIYTDDVRVGELAAAHFLERHFTHFAYFGCDRLRHSVERQRGFAQTLAEQGHSSHSYRNPNDEGFFQELYAPPLDTWLRGLPKPCGLFCNDDTQGFFLMEYALSVGLEVPAELAIIGVNNDPLRCKLAPWPLSSVELNGLDIGYRAAQMLERLMEGTPPGEMIERVSPLQVVARHSTDINGSNDPLMARALQDIQRNLHRSITVEDLAKSLHVSRRVLERHFRKNLGHAPYEEITRARIRKAKQLLADSDWKIQKISEICGFSETNLFYTQFRKREGTSPTLWRSGNRPDLKHDS